MRTRRSLLIVLLSLAWAVPVAMADVNPEGAVLAKQDYKDKGKDKDRENKGRDWDHDRDRDDWRDREDDGWDRRAQGITPGHLPPPGECRVWYDGVPPGQQPPPTDCATARREAAREGGRVIYGDRRDGRRDDDRWDDDDHWGNDRWDDRDRWDERWIRRFESLDRDDDGHLSPREWTGSDRVFGVIDRNDDGRLSRSEIRDAQSRYGSQRGSLRDRFRSSDGNRDGLLSPGEWWGRDEVFDRIDLDNNGYLSWAEVARTDSRGR